MTTQINFSVSATVNQIASIFGIDSWQLQSASFNGVDFFIVPNPFARINPFNPEINLVKQFTGNASDNTALSIDTNLTMSNTKDTQNRRLAVYNLPNYDGYIINDQGATGVNFELVGLIVGSDYLKAIQNIRNSTSTQGQSATFIHPIYGTLKNCYMEQLTVLFNSSEWRAATFTLKIISTSPLFNNPISNDKLNILSTILNELNVSVNALGLISSDLQLAFNLLGINP